jgi:hypothetical protein
MNGYDIENFFTNVSQYHIIPAINKFVQHNKLLKHKGLWFHKYNPKIVYHNKPILTDNFYFISTAIICKIIIHQIQNNYFMIGTEIISKQLIGLPMGGHLSSALAIMLANYAEDLCLSPPHTPSNLYHNNITGVRLTDDGIIVHIINTTQKYAHEIGNYAIKSYIKDFISHSGKSLNMVIEPLNNRYEVAECVIYTHKDNVYTTYNNKNFHHVHKFHCQKIAKGMHPQLIHH